MLEQILSLPIEKKIGQLFFIGLSGVEINDDSQLLLEEVSPGGVCLFARNIRNAEQTRKFLDKIRENSAIEPVLSLDQEGGVVDRLRRVLTPMPSAAALKTIEAATKAAQITSEAIRLLGFNRNFAPVVDIADEPRRKFSNGLYSRAFGASDEETIRLAGAYLETLQRNGCLGCIKHFPGLGASAADSHEELPLIDISMEELFDKDLRPYREIIKKEQAHAIMIAHAGFPRIDLQETDDNGKLLPASLSRNFVTKLLREELNFSGVAITDDLEMGAIVKNYGIGEACKTAVAAGEDMLAICADPDAVRKGFYAVLEAVEKNEISEKRIDESLRRIAHLKFRLSPPLPFDAERLEALSKEIAEFNKSLNYSYGG
ncbi:MAG TPA: glycoside hydrolase family 3 N-terminal domain-containing protein [Pyrinomonadaceae bacterium]|nr:glycoside hydrolase family 3 N-terminal domain-containing protein [Pyrinomonadaceae bacterium]